MQQTTPQAYLIIQLGNRWTDVWRLSPDQIAVIGRSSENQIVVREEGVSRRHARISPLKGGWQVEDLGSRNGTQVGQEKILASRVLAEGDIISVGSCRVTFTLSLDAGFKPTSNAGDHREQAAEANTAVVLPTIVNRLSNSQWSATNLAEQAAAALGHQPSRMRNQDEAWGFFYRLIAELVASPSREAAAQTALTLLLDRVGVAGGGVVVFGPEDTVHGSPVHGSPAAGETSAGQAGLSTRPAGSLPAMAVLAARQASGSAYHRVSDFLVQNVLNDRQGILARNVQHDSKLALAGESGQRETVSIICAPIFENLSERQTMLGLLHIYSSGEERMLLDSDLDFVVGVADNLSIALAQRATSEQLAHSLETSRRQVDALQQQLGLSHEMIGDSPEIDGVWRAIEKAAPTSATVLIRGESGVGKELVARAIHRASSRRDGPLVCLNCAALAPTLLESELFGHEKGAFTGATDRKIGKFEAADGGTLLLDEIGEMNSELQAKFLRALEGQPFERLGGNKPIKTDVRVVAATNRDLEEAVRAKEFRSDLYYRLRVIEIDVPPLRGRVRDIPLLVEYFLRQFSGHSTRRITGIEPIALQVLTRHSWPGNVRELRNVIERAVVLGSQSTLGVEDLSISSLGAGAPTVAAANALSHHSPGEFVPQLLADLERAHIRATLEFTSGNKSKASQLLGIERSTLDRKLKRYESDG
ncbi:sigma 54-interacting transcriptional regulator [Aureliella helgolandensis]|uniref:Transcriptional regulatory protein ZraR n=1 Tax=Aureliella helgolandensis TaxID=2527968 RepID=A0A518GBY4_9BACT|nr:sigma 54-interacting transcriptional regulator [Aureliella helgolandensis]QDV26108.1 Transcriptional regulatory protein ZraR [Aureliella helgolandensis]